MKRNMYLLTLLALLVSSFSNAMDNSRQGLNGSSNCSSCSLGCGPCATCFCQTCIDSCPICKEVYQTIQECNLRKIVELLLSNVEYLYTYVLNGCNSFSKELQAYLEREWKNTYINGGIGFGDMPTCIRFHLERILNRNINDPVFFVREVDEWLRTMSNFALQEGPRQAQGIFFGYFARLNEDKLAFIRHAVETNEMWHEKHRENVANNLEILRVAVEDNNIDVITNIIFSFIDKLDLENQEDNQAYQQACTLINQAVDRAIQNGDQNALAQLALFRNNDAIYNKVVSALNQLVSVNNGYGMDSDSAYIYGQNLGQFNTGQQQHEEDNGQKDSLLRIELENQFNDACSTGNLNMILDLKDKLIQQGIISEEEFSNLIQTFLQ